MVKTGSKLKKEKEIIYCYFISDGNAIKIGKSDFPLERLQQLQTGNSSKLELLGTSPLLNEEEIHDKFKDKHIRGEWFESCDEIITFCEENNTNHYILSLESKDQLIQRIIELERY